MYKLWDKKENIIFPDGVEYSPDQIINNPNYGFSRHNETAIELCGATTVIMDNIPLVLFNYGLDESLKGQEAVDAIIEHRKKEKEQAETQANMAQEGYINTLYATIAYANKDLNLDEEATKKAISDCMYGNRNR